MGRKTVNLKKVVRSIKNGGASWDELAKEYSFKSGAEMREFMQKKLTKPLFKEVDKKANR
ncbi:MAG: hypothetical protein HFJ17_05085 [Clostridia bacterium]|nr:hypothetical protein [Clostridia bacterium]